MVIADRAPSLKKILQNRLTEDQSPLVTRGFRATTKTRPQSTAIFNPLTKGRPKIRLVRMSPILVGRRTDMVSQCY